MPKLTREQVVQMIKSAPEGIRVDLHGADFEGIDLSELDLSWANLRGADLRGTNLRSANLRNAILDRARLFETDLAGADLEGASLSWATLALKDFSTVDLGVTVSLCEVHFGGLGGSLRGIDLSQAELVEADFRGNDLSGADFTMASLVGARFGREGYDILEEDPSSGASGDVVGTELSKAIFDDADCRGADFCGANLCGADFRWANLIRANFSGANLAGTDFSRAKMGWTVLGNVDLRMTRGLDTVEHFGPSTIGMDTAYLSRGSIPESFLQGAGVSSLLIERLSGFKTISESEPLCGAGTFIIGQPVEIEETRHYEFKEITSKNPVRQIQEVAHVYAVAFLNSDGGRIFWGIRDSDRVVVGVQLSYRERDAIRRVVTEKLLQIQPAIAPTDFRIEFSQVCGADRDPIHDLYVVELVVPCADARELYSTGSGEAYVKTDSGKRKLTVPEIKQEILKRYKPHRDR